MTAFHGYRGIVTFTDLVFEITSFSVDATADMADASVMSSAAVTSATHWKTHLPGFKDWTASVEGVLPTTGVGLKALGTTASLAMDTTAGLLWSGNACCTNVSMTNSSDDVARCTMTFQGIAQLTAA